MSELIGWVQDVFFLRPRIAGGSDNTREDYLCTARQLSKYAEDTLGRPAVVQDFSLDFVSAWLASLSTTVDGRIRGAAAVAQKRSASTINHKIRCAMALWRHAASVGAAGPVQAVALVKEERRIPLAWLDTEFDKLCRYCRGLSGMVGQVPAAVWWEALYQVDWSSGERIDALMSCPTSGLDLGKGLLVIPAQLRKDDQDADYPLSARAVELLAQFGAAGRIARVFGDWPFDRRPGKWDTLRRHHRMHQVAAGLYKSEAEIPPRVSGFHRIRKSTASYAAAKFGGPYAQEWMQHSSLKVTRRYLDPRIVGRVRRHGIMPEVGVSRPVQLQLFGDLETEVA